MAALSSPPLRPPPCVIISMRDEPYGRAAARCAAAGFSNTSRFSAVVGKAVDARDARVVHPDALYQMHVGREAPSQLPSMGALGCYLSHYALWVAHANGRVWASGQTYAADDVDAAGGADADDADDDDVLVIAEEDVGWKRTGSDTATWITAVMHALHARGDACDVLLLGGQRLPPSDTQRVIQVASPAADAPLPATLADLDAALIVDGERLGGPRLQGELTSKSRPVTLRALKRRFWGTEAVAITRGGARKLLAASPLPIYQQVDAWMGTQAYHGTIAMWGVAPTWAYQVLTSGSSVQFRDVDQHSIRDVGEASFAEAVGWGVLALVLVVSAGAILRRRKGAVVEPAAAVQRIVDTNPLYAPHKR